MLCSWATGCEIRVGIGEAKENQAGKWNEMSAGPTTLWTVRDGKAVSTQAGREPGSLIVYGMSSLHVNKGFYCPSQSFSPFLGCTVIAPFSFDLIMNLETQLLGSAKVGWKTGQMGLLCWELGEGCLFPDDLNGPWYFFLSKWNQNWVVILQWPLQFYRMRSDTCHPHGRGSLVLTVIQGPVTNGELHWVFFFTSSCLVFPLTAHIISNG